MKVKIIVTIFSLLIYINALSINAIHADSIFKSNQLESDIRTIVENLIYIKVLNSKQEKKYANFLSNEINRHKLIIKKTSSSIKIENLKEIVSFLENENINLEMQVLKILKNNLHLLKNESLIDEMLSLIPNNYEHDLVYQFYNSYIDEQLRLVRLFPKYPSEIKKIDDSEVLGDKFINKDVYLTFDDGPSKYTSEIINILDNNNIKATFFILGNNLKKNNNLKIINSLISENHQIGSHSNTHKNLIKIENQDQLLNEITDLKTELLNNFNYETKVFRAPYGSRDSDILKLINKHYENHILWNIDTQDWRKNFTSLIIQERVIRLVHLNNGGIILFHDNKQKVIDALPYIIEALHNCGYEFRIFS